MSKCIKQGVKQVKEGKLWKAASSITGGQNIYPREQYKSMIAISDRPPGSSFRDLISVLVKNFPV